MKQCSAVQYYGIFQILVYFTQFNTVVLGNHTSTEILYIIHTTRGNVIAHISLTVDMLHKRTLSQFEKILPNPKAKSSVWEHFGFPAGIDGNKITEKNIVCQLCKCSLHKKKCIC